MRFMKIMIIFMIIFIIAISGILIYILSKNEVNTISSDEYNTEFEQNINYEPYETLEKISNRNKYFVVKDIVSLYVSNIKEINLKGTQTTDNNKKIIYDFLDVEYKKDMNITNYSDIKIPIEYNNYDLKIDDIYIFDKSISIDFFIVYCKLGNQDLKLIIKTDSENNTFSIFLDDYMEKYNYSYSMNDENIKISEKPINKNSNNTFNYINKYDKDVLEEYFNNYIHDIKYDIEEAYSKLNQEYARLRFKNIEEYRKYINDNKNVLYNLDISSHYIKKDNNSVEYYCQSKYGFNYIFKEIEFNDYSITLDDYTLENKFFDEKYNEVNGRDKGILNIDKFFKMINTQDYTAAYKVLDENFKQNYFKTQTDFENYMENKVFRYNKVEYKEYSNKITDIYTYKVMLADITEANKTQIEFNIIVKLLEGTDFVMSFGVN